MSGQISALAVWQIHYVENLPKQTLELLTIRTAKLTDRFNEQVGRKASGVFRKHAQQNAGEKLIERVPFLRDQPVGITAFDLVMQFGEPTSRLDIRRVLGNPFVFFDACEWQEEIEVVVQFLIITMKGIVGFCIVGRNFMAIRRDEEAGLVGVWCLALFEGVEGRRRLTVISNAKEKLPRPQNVTRFLSLVLGAGAELSQRCFWGVVDFEQPKRELPFVKGRLDQLGELYLDFGDVHLGPA